MTLLCGGRQSGKTLTGIAAIGLAIVILGHNKLGEGWVLTPSIAQTRTARISFEEVFGWRVSGGLIKKYLMHENTYILDLGFREYRVAFKTADNPDLLRGGRVDFIHLDEAAFLRADVLEVVQPCVLASGGPIWLTSTPNGLNWFHDLYRKAQKGDPNIKAVHAKSTDNPALAPKILARQMASFSDERRRAEFEAEFTSSQGLVYPMFGLEHIKEPPPKFSGEVICGIDPGAADPFAYLYVVRNGEDFFVVDEYFSTERRTLQDHAARIGRHQWEPNVVRRWSDPARAQDNLDLSLTYGLQNWKAKNDLKGGIDAVASKFERGLLHIDPKCENLIRELRSYCYKEKGEVPVDKDNHCLDALRYVIMSERNFSGENEVEIHPAVAFPDSQDYNEIFMPDGTTISGYNTKEGPSPTSKR